MPSASGRDLRLLTVGMLGLIAVLTLGAQLISPARVAFDTSAVRFSFLAAYVGGLLAFLSPCSAAVIPGFFSYSFTTRGSLVRHTYVFYLGLASVFVPLGFSAGLVGRILVDHQDVLIAFAGGMMIVMGTVLLLGIEPLSRLSRRGATQVASARTETGKVLALGAFFGLTTSSCTAPIIAGIIALSTGTGLAPIQSVLLFLVFALGIVTPLFLMAWAGDRSRYLARLRAGDRKVRLFGREYHVSVSKAISGVALVAIGVLFLMSDGTNGLVGWYNEMGATELYERTDEWASTHLTGAWARLTWIAIAAAVLFYWLLHRERAREAESEEARGP